MKDQTIKRMDKVFTELAQNRKERIQTEEYIMSKTTADAIAARRCPICEAWFMTPVQRDNHVQKKHKEATK